jgi:hypothetical protein
LALVALLCRTALFRICINELNILKEELKDMPPENIRNYEETNLTDDLGNKKVLCRRGAKDPEWILNSSNVQVTLLQRQKCDLRHFTAFLQEKNVPRGLLPRFRKDVRNCQGIHATL